MNDSNFTPAGASKDAVNAPPFNHSDWTALSANFQHAVAIDKAGNAWSWGMNQSGQLGLDDKSSSQRNVPTRITTVRNVRGVATGTRHTLVIDGDGQVWGAGLSTFGALGGGAQGRNTPIYALEVINTLSNMGAWAEIYSKRDLTIGKMIDGSWYAWGKNDLGGVGCNSTTAFFDTPQMLFGATKNITRVSVGIDLAAAIDTAGQMYIWGDNSANQVTAISGISTFGKPVTAPVRANVNQGNWLRVAAGATHALAVDRNNQIYAWGKGVVGQLGVGAGAAAQQSAQSSPQKILQLPDASLIKSCLALEANSLNSGAILQMKTGTTQVYMWGSNGYGEVSGLVQSNLLCAYDPYTPTNSDLRSGWFALQPACFDTLALATN